jgi:hypothetical protein
MRTFWCENCSRYGAVTRGVASDMLFFVWWRLSIGASVVVVVVVNTDLDALDLA